MNFKFCPECGFKFDKEYKFCPECGYKLDGAGSKKPEPLFDFSDDTVKYADDKFSGFDAQLKKAEFILTTGDGYNDSKSKDNPTADDIEAAVSWMKKTSDNFVILESKIPLDKIAFIQAIGYGDIKSGSVSVEVQVVDDKKAPVNYGKLLTLQVFKDMLLAYYNGKAPDIRGWEQIAE